MSMDEAAARRVLLAQAIETADTQGKLLGEAERRQIDSEARLALQAEGAAGAAGAAERFLDLRASKVVGAVAGRNPAIAALADVPAWRPWVFAVTPLLTLLLGALTERVADPHRVDLLSLPLLAIVLWNLLAYLLLVLRWLLPWPGRERPVLEAIGRWITGLRGVGRRSGSLRADVTARFQLCWQTATSTVQLRRATGVLHLAALGWGAGVAASLLVQGLVVQYRVGWESTFLDAAQVHAILKLLLTPVVALFPFQPFSVQEVAALQLGPGDLSRADPRWVGMYAALLLVLVIVPRAVLAGFAFWRAAALARRIPLALGEPYFQRLLSLLTPARVQLSVVSHRAEDLEPLLRVLVQQGDRGAALISSVHGDGLHWLDLSGSQAPAAADRSRGGRPAWLQRLLKTLRRPAATQDDAVAPGLREARERTDVVLHLVGAAADLETARPLLQWLGRPVLVLVNRPEGVPAGQPGLVAQSEAAAREMPLVAGVLSFDFFARCWVQEGALLDAVAACLPEAKLPGFGRIMASWEERNHARFGQAMSAVAQHLLFAARQVQEVPSAALSVKSLVNPAERQAQAQARQAAMDAVVERLQVSAAQLFATLRRLHGVEDAAAGALQLRLEEKFVVQQAVATPQAGLAGAATGAAMGASVDLVVGGLTLGAATALGALVGGSAAFIAAAWKNRATSSGATAVQLSDEMMQALVEAALLRYLAVIHYGRGGAGAADELRPFWKSDVVAAVEAQKGALAPFWSSARAQAGDAQAAVLARELETIARKLLNRLYPPAPRGAGRPESFHPQ
ncbi:MAG: DUF3482 domain-containing protein [Ramlibacter sp.]|nr:DUF3482 domain-containing protein [Ramlibacter sp.]